MARQIAAAGLLLCCWGAAQRAAAQPLCTPAPGAAPPGAQEDFYRKGNPDGKSLREIFGKPIPCPEPQIFFHALASDLAPDPKSIIEGLLSGSLSGSSPACFIDERR